MPGPRDVKVSETVKRKTAKRGRSVKVKFASAHDLRRAFGLRWAMRVMPPILMLMMRHESIITTQQYYVGRDAEAAADAIWQAFSDTSSDTSQISPDSNGTTKPQHVGSQQVDE